MFKPADSENGFTFLETMIALLVLVVCLTWVGPILERVSQERSSIQQYENALSILNNQLILWSAGSSVLPAEENKVHTLYHLDWKAMDNQTIQLCVTWKNSVERKQVICGKANQ